jgi:lysophospholipase L1-like esterase
VAIVVAAAVLTACGSSSGSIGAGAVPSVSPSGPALTYVAIGASETLGFGARDPIRQAWTQVFYRTALPRAVTLVNLGIPGATVLDALQREVPEAVRLNPDIVTVWLNVNDLMQGVTPDEFGRRITTLLRDLRAAGDASILVANTPPLGQLPRFAQCRPFAPAPGGGCDEGRQLTPEELDSLVGDYNAAISWAAAGVGAVVVDLHGLGVSAEREGTMAELVSRDGFHPSTAGHRAVGSAFAQAFLSIGGQ